MANSSRFYNGIFPVAVINRRFTSSMNRAIDRVKFHSHNDYDHISRLLSCDDAFDSFKEFYRNVDNLNRSDFFYWPSWSTIDEGTREELWQSSYERRRFRYRTCIDEEGPFPSCKRTLFVDLLNAKTTGEQISKANKTSAVLSFFLRHRWSAVSRLDMLLDAKVLLQRSLYYWEGVALIFLQSQLKKTKIYSQQESTKSRRVDTSFHGEITGDMPVKFADIVDALLKTGLDVNTRDENNDDLMLALCRGYKVGPDIADFLEFVLKRGYDVERGGEELARVLCKSRYESDLSETKLRMLNELFNAGLRLSHAAKRDLIPEFVVHALGRADGNTLGIVRLLLERGCRADDALVRLGNFGHKYWLRTRRIDDERVAVSDIFNTVRLLLDNGARVQQSPDEARGRSFLVPILDYIKDCPNPPDMLDLLQDYAGRGLNVVNAIGLDNQNLLMSFCKNYKNTNLTEVIEYLATSGIDVNALDNHGQNVLFYLSKNESTDRHSVCRAVRLLVQLRVDAGQTNSSGKVAMMTFLAIKQCIEQPHNCCYHSALKHLNEGAYWEMFELLWREAGGAANQMAKNSHMALTCLLHELCELRELNASVLFLREPLICGRCFENCLKSASMDEAQTTPSITSSAQVFNFIGRLIGIVKVQEIPYVEYLDQALRFVCVNFAGEQLVDLVKIFCENGANVNARFNDRRLGCAIVTDIIGVLIESNPSQAHLRFRLIEIMKPYGYERMLECSILTVTHTATGLLKDTSEIP